MKRTYTAAELLRAEMRAYDDGRASGLYSAQQALHEHAVNPARRDLFELAAELASKADEIVARDDEDYDRLAGADPAGLGRLGYYVQGGAR
jgi:hypothetical protein